MRASRISIVIFSAWLAFVVSGGWTGAQAQTFPGGATTAVHPGVMLSQAQLNYMKVMVQAHQEPFYTAFLKAQSSTWGSLTYVPLGPPAGGIMQCGSTSMPDFGCSASDSDGTAAYVQALLWYITGNQTYANNAIKILNTYSSNFKGYAGFTPGDTCPAGTDCSNGPLQAAWDSQKWPRAAEILRYSNAGWSATDAAAFGAMLKKYMLPQLINGSTSNGNWETSMIEGLIGIGVYNDDAATFNTGVTYWQQRVPSYFYYHADGGQAVLAPRGTANWYGQAVYDPSVDGVSQETCRDFGHAQYGISGSLDAAETAGIQGVNLYQNLQTITDASQGTFAVNAQNRLTSALEFNAYYLLKNPIPTSVCGGAVTLQIYPVDEIGYNEYHNRLGLSLPNTLQYLQTVIRQLPAQSMTESHIMIWETLTHGGDASSLQPFMMWTNGTNATLQSGSSVSYTTTVVPGSVTNPSVALSLSGLPAGMSYSFSPATVSGAGTSTLTITASSTAPSGSYALAITGSSGAATYTNPLSLLVNAANANFSIASTPAVVPAVAGDAANFPVTLTPINNYVGAVSLSVTAGLPAGATATFSSPTVTNTSPASTLTVLTTGTTTPGAYSLTISGTDGVLTNKTTALLIVNSISNACILQLGNTFVSGTLPAQTGTFTAQWDSTPSTSLNNSNIGLSLGVQAAFTGFAVAARFNPTGDIDARNGGAFVAASTIPYTAGTSYHFRAVVNVPTNTYSMYVTPAGQTEITVGTNYSFRTEQAGITSIDHWDATSSAGTITLCNMIVATPNFSVSAPPISQTVTAGTPAAYTATITPLGGYTGSVTLSVSGLPSGATASFKPATVAVGASAVTSIMTVATTGSTATGVYPMTFTATDGTLTNTAYPELTINPPCVAPAATSQKVTVAQNGAVAITLAGTPGSGCAGTDALSSSVTVNPLHGVLTGTAPNLFYTPTAGFAGADSFSFTVTDANAVTPTSSATAVTITVAAPVSSAPVLVSLTPAVVLSGSTGLVLTVNGSGFTSGSTVLWNGASRTTTYISSTQLTEAVTASDISASGLASITVSTPGTSGGVSLPITLAIDSSSKTALFATNTSFTVTHGQAVSVQFGFSNIPAGALTSADCYNLPAAVNCSYSAQTEMLTLTTGLSTPPGTYQILVVSTVTPKATASVRVHSSRGELWYCLLGLPLGLTCFGRKRRRWLYPAAGILSLFLVLMVGCSSGSTITSTPTNTATSQASTGLTLTVN
jgi:Bacterial Ig domain/Alginate lyase